MNNASTNKQASTEEAEKLFRETGASYGAEHIRSIIDRYLTEQNYYNAFALALDYYELTQPFFETLKGSAFSDVLYDIYTLFCDEGDKDRAIALAAILVDEYRILEKHEKIIRLNDYFLCAFKEITKSTSSFLIMKAAIQSAIYLIEGITDEPPPDELTALICETITYLPLCSMDDEFMMSAIQRINACYKSESKPRLIIIAHFLPALKQLFGGQGRWMESLIGKGNLSTEGITKYIDVLEKYRTMLFSEDAPVLLETMPYALPGKIELTNEYYQVICEVEDLASKLVFLSKDQIHLHPELSERHEKILDYFLSLSTGSKPFSDFETTYFLVTCYAMWRNIDIAYVKSNIEPYAQNLMAYEIEDSTPTGSIYFAQTVLIDLLSVYDITGDADKQFKCCLKHLEFSK